jgi:1-hydroxycarotenoid 3,4-desaturase
MTQIVVIGAGMGGLVAAVEAARAGFDVTLIEKADAPGGKIRTINAGGQAIDAGPTVFTMKPVFDELFARSGQTFDSVVKSEKLNVLARHFWPDGSRLDLFADRARSIDAIAAFAGYAEAKAFENFSAEASRLYGLLRDKFIFADRLGVGGMIAALGLPGLAALTKLGPFATLWQKLGRDFKDPRLQQLFARYATYSGGSPFLSPATLMLIADVEMQGVWHIEGGMKALAQSVADLAVTQGVRFHFGEAVASIDAPKGCVQSVTLQSGEKLKADKVIFNGDVAALADGLLGPSVTRAGIKMPQKRRSLSAMTWCVSTPACGHALSHHNVFFDWDYCSEFDDVFKARRLPRQPTLYVCAQDRGNHVPQSGRERLLMLINAPADGDSGPLPAAQIMAAERAIAGHLARQGISLDDAEIIRTEPHDFATLFPGSGGALYGQAPHGWIRSVTRGDARTAIEGLYRCGGSVHPGAGVPLAALSGLKAVSALMADCNSISPSRRAVISGGMSTRSARTEPTA